MFSTDYYATEINRWIDELTFPSQPVGLYEPIVYMLAGGGKRLRPTLLCAVCESLGVPYENARSQALGIEMFHNFTLLHDDVMDNSDMRHGKPTVHRQWNVATAILSGDTMLTLASRLIEDSVPEIRTSVNDLFNDTAIKVYEGQQYDLNFESRNNVNESEYIEMIRLKTAVLLGCACSMGALVARASNYIVSMFYQYGIKLGLAFQLRDDFLDTFGDPVTFGKAIGGDILNDKKTWMSIKAMNIAPEAMRDALTLTGNDKIAAIKKIYTEHEIDKECLAMIGNFANDAVEALKSISLSSDDKEFFTSIALSTINRKS